MRNSQLILYQTEDGKIKIDVRFQEETVWLSQKLMAELFQTMKQNRSLHVKGSYEAGELAPDATFKQFLTVRIEGGRQVERQGYEFYGLIVAEIKNRGRQKSKRCLNIFNHRKAMPNSTQSRAGYSWTSTACNTFRI